MEILNRGRSVRVGKALPWGQKLHFILSSQKEKGAEDVNNWHSRRSSTQSRVDKIIGPMRNYLVQLCLLCSGRFTVSHTGRLEYSKSTMHGPPHKSVQNWSKESLTLNVYKLTHSQYLAIPKQKITETHDLTKHHSITVQQKKTLLILPSTGPKDLRVSILNFSSNLQQTNNDNLQDYVSAKIF